jgi:hypothetical protein
MNSIIDKHNYLNILADIKPLVLELGCGPKKRKPEAIGIDLLNYPDVDIVGDIFDIVAQLPSASVEQIYSYHFIEHIFDINKLMMETARVLKVGGTMEIVAPHFSNPYFYSDPTHQRSFGLYSFCYLSVGSCFKRQVPVYERNFPFRLVNVDLIFKSPRPFYLRYVFKWLVGKIFNLNNFMKELYEENFCYIFPCYEIKYLLTRVEL